MKPNYMQMLARTSKQVPVIVKRLIQHEKLELTAVHQLESRQTYDVVLLTAERLLIVRHYFGSKQAHFQEFERSKWDELLPDPARPNLGEFLRKYSEQVLQLDEKWIGVGA